MLPLTFEDDDIFDKTRKLGRDDSSSLVDMPSDGCQCSLRVRGVRATCRRSGFVVFLKLFLFLLLLWVSGTVHRSLIEYHFNTHNFRKSKVSFSTVGEQITGIILSVLRRIAQGKMLPGHQWVITGPCESFMYRMAAYQKEGFPCRHTRLFCPHL